MVINMLAQYHSSFENAIQVWDKKKKWSCIPHIFNKVPLCGFRGFSGIRLALDWSYIICGLRRHFCFNNIKGSFWSWRKIKSAYTEKGYFLTWRLLHRVRTIHLGEGRKVNHINVLVFPNCFLGLKLFNVYKDSQ